ncbi:hypothetical protein [Agrobacterium sp. NPDC090283]|uniref:hypothetical protein n=1 Tax=Agrobacterium sp. NPDC090283 TaxID=3363920 RepID=UPI003839FE5C
MATLAIIVIVASACLESSEAAAFTPGAEVARVIGEHKAATVLIAAKKKPTRARRNPGNGDQLIGPASNPLAEILGGIAMGALGVGSGGGSGGCAVDYTTPNPTSCRVSRYTGPVEEPVQRSRKPRKQAERGKGKASSYTCFNNSGLPYHSSTYKLGCYFSELDKPGSRLSDGLSNIK